MSSPDQQESPCSKKDLQELKEDLQTFFKASMTELLNPVQAKLDELTEGLRAAGHAVESALEMAEKVQNKVAALKRSETIMQTKTIHLENRWRLLNLKFRGIAEGAEQAPEALEKRKLLKPFSEKLLEAKVRFRWSATSNITVYKDGSLIQASNLKTGLLLLQKLNIPLTAEEEALQADSTTENSQASGE
ncbi:UNVERIFIED_CONTAM: hypothetical protein K2H54_054365 [Gekko kuhli]